MTITFYHATTDLNFTGLFVTKGTAFVSRDINAAKDALTNKIGSSGCGSIVVSNIPKDLAEILIKNERPYDGFYPYNIKGSSEIPLRTEEEQEIFNRYIAMQYSIWHLIFLWYYYFIGDFMKIYYIHEATNNCHSMFEGTAEQFSVKFGGGANNEESISKYVSDNGLKMVVFNDVPDDYYEKQTFYNLKGIIIGYTLFMSMKIGY